MTQIYRILLCVPGIIIAVGMHEYIKAIASVKFGDGVPKREGRCTLNLFKHVDPLGFICMIISCTLFMYGGAATCGLGWGKPVNTSAVFYKKRKNDTIIVYAVPIFVNVLISVIFLCAARLLYGSYIQNDTLRTVLVYVADAFENWGRINITFAIFNIIPVYPLAGAKILSAFLKPQSAIKYAQYERIFQYILLFLAITGIIANIIAPIANAFMRVVL